MDFDVDKPVRDVIMRLLLVALPTELLASAVACRERRRADCATGFLHHALAYYRALGLRIERVLTDNGTAFDSRLFVDPCDRQRIKRLHTRYYRPQTNGKAEPFIQTALREWAYGRAYSHSRERTAQLPRWLHHYKWHRPHSSLRGLPPISRLPLAGDNVLSLHT
jgi:transposase InsO family protein